MTNQEEILKIQTAMKEAKDRRSYERFQSVYLSLKGYTQREIADITGRCVKTIHHYVSAYKEKGLDGLEITYSPGAPTKLTKEQQRELVETIAYKQPVDVGFPAKYNWTLSLITQMPKSTVPNSFNPSWRRIKTG